MPTVTPDARLFGVDLRLLGHELVQAWADVLQAPWLAWLTPDAPVRLLQADGGQSVWLGGQCQPAGAPGQAPFVAVQLPEDLLLRSSQALPAMDAGNAASAAALQAQALSPFTEADLLWAHRIHADAAGGQRLDIVLASRRQVAQHLQAQAARWHGATPEVWATQPGQAPLVLAGYGEAARQRHAVRGRRVRVALLALALALLAAMALTPTLQLRARAIDAVHAYDALAHRTAPLVQEREQFLQTADKLQALSGLLQGRIEPLRVLDRLTNVLPDDTALQSFTLKGDKVTLTGLSDNAAAVMQVLGQQAGIREVRAPSPAVRAFGANSKESFVIEFTLDPQTFGVATVAPVPPPQAPAAAPVPAPAPAASAAAPAPQAPAAAAQAPAASGQMPVFGGSPAQPAKPAAAKPQHKDKP